MKETLQYALKEAGKILMDNFGKISNYSVKENQSSIVTQTDVDSERKIMKIISSNFPHHNLLGEETGFQNKSSEYTWVVDPIDGTSNFAAGIPWFGIIICLMKDFKPVMGACYLPVQEQLYFAEKGKGATLNGINIAVSKASELKNILAVYSLDYSDEPDKTEHESKIIQQLVQNVRNLRSTNCLIDLCYTADGKFGVIINQSTKIWDIAGPGLIIEEAGGKVTDLNGNKFNFTLTESNYNRNFKIVGSNKLLHSAVIKILNS
jgi:myo-inositol-1(or 4)-monophosphatase